VRGALCFVVKEGVVVQRLVGKMRAVLFCAFKAARFGCRVRQNLNFGSFSTIVQRNHGYKSTIKLDKV